jgi:hypothetical protein
MMFTGRTADGSDAHPSLGMFVSPDGEQWSNMPFTAEQRRYDKAYRHYEKIINHVKDKRTFREEHELVKSGASLLPKAYRATLAYIVEHLPEGLNGSVAFIAEYEALWGIWKTDKPN